MSEIEAGDIDVEAKPTIAVRAPNSRSRSGPCADSWSLANTPDRFPAVRGPGPEQVATFAVEGQDQELLNGIVDDGIDFAVEAESEIFLSLLANRGGQEDPIPPDNWRGMS